MKKVISLIEWFISSKVWGRIVIEFRQGKIVNIEKTETLKAD